MNIEKVYHVLYSTRAIKKVDIKWCDQYHTYISISNIRIFSHSVLFFAWLIETSPLIIQSAKDHISHFYMIQGVILFIFMTFVVSIKLNHISFQSFFLMQDILHPWIKEIHNRGSAIEPIWNFLYVQPIFIDEKVLEAMSQNFKALSWL